MGACFPLTTRYVIGESSSAHAGASKRRYTGEERGNEPALRAAQATPWLHEVIVVDGLSRAATRGVARLCCQLSGLYRNRGAAKVTRYAKDSFTVRGILS